MEPWTPPTGFSRRSQTRPTSRQLSGEAVLRVAKHQSSVPRPLTAGPPRVNMLKPGRRAIQHHQELVREAHIVVLRPSNLVEVK